jgi:hypothetical protein
MFGRQRSRHDTELLVVTRLSQLKGPRTTERIRELSSIPDALEKMDTLKIGTGIWP